VLDLPDKAVVLFLTYERRSYADSDERRQQEISAVASFAYLDLANAQQWMGMPSVILMHMYMPRLSHWRHVTQSPAHFHMRALYYIYIAPHAVAI